MREKLTDIELLRVSETIASLLGLYFPSERWALLNRNLEYASVEFGFDNIKEFIQWVLSAPLNKGQIEILASHLTVTETYFWREPQVFTALTDFILPELFQSKKNTGKCINIWSAGCSTGEEPYSVAIAIHKTIPAIKDWNIKIIATDINSKALLKAKNGIYSQWSFRNPPAWLKNTYFNQRPDRKYEVIPEIRKMVKFSCCSLTENNNLYLNGTKEPIDLIFCRNVLMYLTNKCAEKISGNLSESLSENGWLIVSSCELSPGLFPKLTVFNFPGAILYRKSQKLIPHLSYTPLNKIFEPVNNSSLPIPFNNAKPIHSSTSTLSLNMIKNTPALHSRSKVGSAFDISGPEIAAANKVPIIIEKEKNQFLEKKQHESYAEKIIAIRSLADKDQMAEALLECNKAIKSYKLSPGLYFLQASILQSMNKSLDAIKSLKQSIYIDPDYIMGHFMLGNLYFRQGNLNYARRNFNNALNLLNTISEDNILPESEGLSVKYIKEIVLTNLKMKNPL